MERIQRRARQGKRGLPAVALAGIAAVAVTGCGGGSNYKNNPRPPAPINITAAVSPKRISVSPTHFGAGPIVMIVTNQSASSQDVTFESDQLNSTKPGIVQSTGPINPQDTAQIKIDVPVGSYVVRTGDKAIAPASVIVAGERASAQNLLLQP